MGDARITNVEDSYYQQALDREIADWDRNEQLRIDRLNYKRIKVGRTFTYNPFNVLG